ncbi:MAG: tetratricopeptide repeat protein [Xanthomonadaceae bacterium]|nr:tetratricopeptide repeat protein [Xanthomonadaceae bacterium]
MAALVAISVVLGLLVLAALLRPLWHGARGLALGVGVLMLTSAGLLYAVLGTPQALDPAAREAPQTLEAAITQLKTALARDPQQPDGWVLLGQAYQRTGNAIGARDAYAKAAVLAPDDADILTDAAQARAMAAPQHAFDTQALGLLHRALQANPQHQRARWFLGVAQRQAGQNADAAATWAPLLAQVDAATATRLRKEIDTARALAKLPPLPDTPAAAAPPALLTVKVTLDQALAARVRLQPDATVFVIARQIGGPPMPVAAQKHAVSELPFTARLSDADSPMPTLKLSQMQQVELLARLSASGEAMPQPGDLQSKPQRVQLPAKGPLELVIGTQ